MQRTIEHAVVVSYLVLLMFGMSYAVVRYEPVPLRPLTLFFYGMLAPYQGYNRMNEAFLVEGQRTDGSWERLDLAPYFPVGSGERNMRERWLYENRGGHADVDDLYRRIAERVRTLEAARGRNYASVRLSWMEWEPSPDGFHADVDHPTRTRFLVVVP